MLAMATEFKIVKQPQTQIVKVGATMAFTVEATGEGLTYQWEYSVNNGAGWMNSSSSSATIAEFTYSPVRAYHNGYLYRCVITDATGAKLTSEAARVIVSAAKEYSITYTYTGQENITYKDMEVALSNFTASGETSRTITKVTSLKYSHYHSMTNTSGWYFFTRLVFSDGTYLDSDEVQSARFDGSVKEIINTWTTLPTAAQMKKITSIQVWAKSQRSGSEYALQYGGELYWRATETHPLTLTVSFEACHPVFQRKNGVWVELNVDGTFGKRGEWKVIESITKL